MGEGLTRLLAMVRRRLRVNRLLAGLALGLLLAGGMVLCWALISRLTVLPDVDVAVTVVAGLVVVATTVAATAGRIDHVQAARVADRWLDSDDAFASALVLPTDEASDPMGLATLQATRAERRAAAVAELPGKAEVPTRRLAVGTSVLALAGLLLVVPNPRDDDRARLEEERLAAEEAAETLEEAADRL